MTGPAHIASHTDLKYKISSKSSNATAENNLTKDWTEEFSCDWELEADFIIYRNKSWLAGLGLKRKCKFSVGHGVRFGSVRFGAVAFAGTCHSPVNFLAFYF